MLMEKLMKPYSIVITEAISLEADRFCYRVEGLGDDNDPDIFGYGTLDECMAIFDQIKDILIKNGQYVREVGCCSSRILIPRQMLVNYSPYHVWKTLYRNLQTQDKVAEADRLLSVIRHTRPPGVRQWTG